MTGTKRDLSENAFLVFYTLVFYFTLQIWNILSLFESLKFWACTLLLSHWRSYFRNPKYVTVSVSLFGVLYFNFIFFFIATSKKYAYTVVFALTQNLQRFFCNHVKNLWDFQNLYGVSYVHTVCTYEYMLFKK